MFCEYSPYSTNLASDWLRAESSPVDEEKEKKWMMVSLGTSLASEGIYLLTCGKQMFAQLRTGVISLLCLSAKV